MKTKEQVTTEFTKELRNLLAKYEAELSAEDHGEYGADVRMTVDIPGKWGYKGTPLQEWTSINLGRRIDGMKQSN